MNKIFRILFNVFVLLFIIGMSSFFIVQGLKFRDHVEAVSQTAPLVLEAEQIPESVGANSQSPELILQYHNSRLATNSFWISIIAVFVTFLAFFVQYTFNVEQRGDIVRERDMSQFFHLMDVYRANTGAVQVFGRSGKDAFHYMFYEYKALYNIVYEYLKKKGLDWDAKVVNQLAFAFFINGITLSALPDFNTTRLEKEEKTALMQEIRALLFKYQERKKGYTNIRFIMNFTGPEFLFFDGHRPRLVPYVKFIFLLLNWISVKKLTDDQKRNYMRYIIAEMTDHEIGLLYGYVHYRLCCNVSDFENWGYDPRYEPLLQMIYSALPAEMDFKFKFDDPDFLNPVRTLKQ